MSNEYEELLPTTEELFSICSNDTQVLKAVHQYNRQTYEVICELIKNIKMRYNNTLDSSMKGEDVYNIIDTIQQVRHDLVHVMVADTLHVAAHEKAFHSTLESLFSIKVDSATYPVFNKTPDIVYQNISKSELWIMDVAVSISAKMVSGFKEQKYRPLAIETANVFQKEGIQYKVDFFPIVMDQNLSNLDIALLPLGKEIPGRKKQVLRLLVRELNSLIYEFQTIKLKNDSFEIEKFHQLRLKSAGTEQPMIHPLPPESSLEKLICKEIYKEAQTKYVQKEEKYFDKICDEFKRKYVLESPKSLFDSQIFSYPSEKEIHDSILQMERVAEGEFQQINKPKPSLHFSLALTSKSEITHDGKLDLLQINNLKRVFSKGLTVKTKDPDSYKLLEMLTDLFNNVPDIEHETEKLKYWSGKEKAETGVETDIKGKTTLNFKFIKKYKGFLESYIGLNKKDEQSVRNVKSLAFWNENVREYAEQYICSEGLKLSEQRRSESFEPPKRTGIEAVDNILNAQFKEIKPVFDKINNCQAAYVSKQISEMCQSILIQRKKEANHVQILNKGDRGFFVITFPHRLLETKKTGNTVPFICLSMRKKGEKMINEEIVEHIFYGPGDIQIMVSKGMRLDVPRIESLCHSYELYVSVMLGWMTSGDENSCKPDTDMKLHAIANGFLFYLCHSVHLRTGGLLDNLRYMFMDVTAEKSNFRMFMMDNGKMALKNSIQIALYSRIRSTLPKYSLASINIKQREPVYDTVVDEVQWGSLGVSNVHVPSLISPGYYFDSFMAATNEIVGLFFAVPKDLHGEFHKMVSLEKIPFVWQVSFNRRKKYLLEWEDVVKAISKGGAEKQTVDLEFVYHVGKWVNDMYLKPREGEFLKKLSQIRMQDSLLSHKQFTSSHSCIRRIDEKGYAERNKVLLTVLERIEDVYESNVPSFWDFCIDCVASDEPFRFVISPKGQRTKDDREIYIGNLESFSLRLVEKIFGVVCSFQSNEAIHVAGDRKFVSMQTCFKRILNWSRNQVRLQKQKKTAKEKLKLISNLKKERLRMESNVALEDWSKSTELQENITIAEDEIFKELTGEHLSKRKYKQLSEIEKRRCEEEEERMLTEVLKIPDFDPNIVFLNGDRSKWSAADICEKFCTYIDALTVIPEHIRILMKCILIKHDSKSMHVSPKLHTKYLTFSNNEFNEFKEICGNEPCGTIKGNWFQGMLNFTSSSFHSGTQEVSWNLIKSKLLNQLPTEFIGLCHSDDEIAFLGFGTFCPSSEEYQFSNNLHKFPLETILLFHNILGSLGCMNYSQKKTNVHFKVSEFVSLFLIWGDQQFPFMKHLATAISGLPGTGLDDDMYAALSQVMMAAMRGCPMSTLLPILELAQQRIDRMYSTGKNMHNDAEEIMKIPRQYLPLELGGRFLPGPLPLLLAGPAIHDVAIIKAALEGRIPDRQLNAKVLKCFYALTPEGLIKTVADDDPLAQQDKYTSSKLSGFQGMIFKNYLPKKKDKLLDRFNKQMTREKELEFMLRRPTASVLKPSTGKDALDYWKMVISKPAWIRSVRKEGARGMAIKRAQWVKGEHVKLRYDDEWCSFKKCLQEISDYVHDETISLGYHEVELLKSYVYNVSSTTCSILNYLSDIYVKKVNEVDNSIRVAELLTRPATYRDVKNDVKKVISYIWDKASYSKEFQHMKFDNMLADDIAKVKSFYKPTLERKPRTKLEGRLFPIYNALKVKVENGESWKVALDKVLSKLPHLINDEIELVRLVHEVYSEPSWVYKQFEDQIKSRVVITSANNPSYKVTERIIMYNTLRWGRFHMNSGVTQIRQHPTLLPNVVAREDFKFAEIIDTIGLVYKRLAQMKLPIRFLQKIFHNIGMKDIHGTFESLYCLLRKCLRYAIESENITMQAKKVVAVAEVAILGTTLIAQQLLVNYKKPLGAWTKEQKHVGGGKYLGEFVYKCWVGDHMLTVSGSDTSRVETQRWNLISNDNIIATDLVMHAYNMIFSQSGFDYNMPKLAFFAKETLGEEKMVKSQQRWCIKCPTVGERYLPVVKIDKKPLLLIGQVHDAIKMHPSGLQLWQSSKIDKKMIKLISIKHTNTKLNRSQDLIVNPLFRGKLVVDGVDMTKLIKLKMLPPFLNNMMETVTLPELEQILVIKNDSINKDEIELMFSYIKRVLILPLQCPTDVLREVDFPVLSGNEVLSQIMSGELEEEDEEAALWDMEGYIEEIPVEISSDQIMFEAMSVMERELFLEQLHSKSQDRKPLLDAELFADPDRQCFELHSRTNGNDEDIERQSTSSGSSKVSFVELLNNTPGGHLEEKLLYQAMGIKQDTKIPWHQLMHCILKRQLENKSVWPLKKFQNRNFVLRCWNIIAEKFNESATSDDIFMSETSTVRQFLRDYFRTHRALKYVFENFSHKILDEIFELTYDFDDAINALI